MAQKSGYGRGQGDGRGGKPRQDRKAGQPDRAAGQKKEYSRGRPAPAGRSAAPARPYAPGNARPDGPPPRREAPRGKEPPAPAVKPGDEDAQPFLIIGRNAVREAVKSGRSIDYLLAQREADGSLREILALARERKLVIRECDRKKLDELCLPFGHGGKPANHQGVVACAAGVEYRSVADILAVARERGEPPFVIALDGVTDPHNLGSIIRSADCAGAHGVIINKRRSASVTAATVKAAAGATEHVRIARVTNTTAALGELKKAGLWIAGADMKGAPMAGRDLKGPLALVIGGEGAGLSKLVRDNCDFLVSIPLYGRMGSLNAAMAAAVLMYEKKRQDAL